MPDASPIEASHTVAQIVLDHPECAQVFRDHRIDFCCRGNVAVDEACSARGVDVGAVLRDLDQAVRERSGAPERDFRKMSTTALVGYILERHHEYLRCTLPWVRQMAEKVARVHSERNGKLVELDAAVRTLEGALGPHLDREEDYLFPAMMKREPDVSLVARELRETMHEHLEVGVILDRIRRLTDDYVVPSWGCGTYRALLAELRSLENDVHKHVHLENHVLAPRFGVNGT